MPKNYRLQFVLDDKLAAVALKRSETGLARVERAALKTANAIEKASGRAYDSAVHTRTHGVGQN
jgi:hypothetical protein